MKGIIYDVVTKRQRIIDDGKPRLLSPSHPPHEANSTLNLSEIKTKMDEIDKLKARIKKLENKL